MQTYGKNCKQQIPIIIRRGKINRRYAIWFSRRRNSINHLVKFHEDICDRFVNDFRTVLINFDLEKAFDRIWQYHILKQLKKWKIKENLLKFIEKFLTDRYFQVRCQNKETTPHKDQILATSKIIKPPVKYVLFADDITIYVTIKKRKYSKNSYSKSPLANYSNEHLAKSLSFPVKN